MAEVIELNCDMCVERFTCSSVGYEKTFEKRFKATQALGFCIDYDFDKSITTDPHQVCHEERTFDEIFNAGHLPLHEDDEI